MKGGAGSISNMALNTKGQIRRTSYLEEMLLLTLTLYGGTPEENSQTQKDFLRYSLLGFTMDQERCDETISSIKTSVSRGLRNWPGGDTIENTRFMNERLRNAPEASRFLQSITGCDSVEAALQKIEQVYLDEVKY